MLPCPPKTLNDNKKSGHKRNVPAGYLCVPPTELMLRPHLNGPPSSKWVRVHDAPARLQPDPSGVARRISANLSEAGRASRMARAKRKPRSRRGLPVVVWWDVCLVKPRQDVGDKADQHGYRTDQQ